MPASLYLVSTPIGNLEDISLRALRILKQVSLIAAEDTRRTAVLLHHFGVQTPTTSLHEHNEREKLPALLNRLAAGDDIALVSDAGTPGVSDPGYRLIDAAIRAGNPVVPIPGASAVLAALVASGFPAEPFVFLGFPPTRSFARSEWFRSIAEEKRTVVLFEAPHRIQTALHQLSTCLGDRPICVCRELTKIHEEFLRGPASALLGHTTKERGEFTIVISPSQTVLKVETAEIPDDLRLFACFGELTKESGFTRRKAIAETAKRFGLPPKQVYEAVERAKKAVP
jgi:16S rRNA (cytidine1402-2'-O)-methyltransferase